MNLGLLILRLVVGLLFVGHGAQKLFGIWGGHGLKATAGFFEQIGLKPGRFHAAAAGLMEFGGGLLLASRPVHAVRGGDPDRGHDRRGDHGPLRKGPVVDQRGL